MASQTSGLEEDVDAELQALESELAADNEVRRMYTPKLHAAVGLLESLVALSNQQPSALLLRYLYELTDFRGGQQG